MSKAKLKKTDSLPRPAEAPSQVIPLSFEPKPGMIGIAQEIAGSDIAQRNWKYDRANEFFPNEPQFRTVDKYYPYASGGPLLVDEPYLESEIGQCERKAKVLKQLGYRYLYITPKMTTQEAYEALHKSQDKAG